MKILFIFHWVMLFPILSAEAQQTLALNNPAKHFSRSVAKTQTADAIIGDWLDDKKTVRIQVYKQYEQYHARIVWLKEEKIAPVGTQVMQNLQYTEKDTWQEGQLYYPRTNSWYDCRCTLHNSSVMKVRIYIGTPLFGKTIEFNRIETATN